jgi:hypothetical protein
MLFIKIFTCACSMNTGTCINIHGLVITSNRKAEKLFSKKLAKLSSPPNIIISIIYDLYRRM